MAATPTPFPSIVINVPAPQITILPTPAHSGGFGWAQAGPLAAWISSLSVFLALFIIFRDKRSAARAQASKVSSFLSPIYGAPESKWTATIYNESDSAIQQPTLVFGTPDKQWLRQRLGRLRASWCKPTDAEERRLILAHDHQTVYHVIPGRESVSFIVTFTGRERDADHMRLLLFTDTAGVRWRRDLDTAELARQKRSGLLLGFRPSLPKLGDDNAGA